MERLVSRTGVIGTHDSAKGERVQKGTLAKSERLNGRHSLTCTSAIATFGATRARRRLAAHRILSGTLVASLKIRTVTITDEKAETNICLPIF